MRLVSADKVIERLNVGRSVGGNSSTVVQSALDGVTPIMESLLSTSLSDAKRTDYFGHTRSRFSDYKPLTHKLAQRFVVARTVKVYLSVTGNPVTDIDDTKQATLLTEGVDYILDAGNGEVMVLATVPRGQRVLVVTYSAGFDSESEDIPEWMQQAAVSAAIRVHNAHAVVHNKKDTLDMSKELSSVVLSQVQEHRYSGLGVVYPEMSLVK